MPLGRIVCFDTHSSWGIIQPDIQPDNNTWLIYGRITCEVPPHLHLCPSIRLLISGEFDDLPYQFASSYNPSNESSDTYDTIQCFDATNNLAVVSNGVGRLMLCHYSNTNNTIPPSLVLPPHCQLFCDVLE